MYAVWMAPGSTRMRGVEAEIDVIAGPGKANSLATAFDTTAKSELLPLKRSGVPQFAEFVSNWISKFHILHPHHSWPCSAASGTLAV